MSNTTEAPFSATFKISTPEGAELLVTTRPNITTKEEQFEAIEEINQLVKELKAAGYAIPAGYSGGSKKFGNIGSPGAPAEADERIPAESRSCTHGPRVYKTGDGKRGKWVGYQCPTRKCDMIWGA